MITDIMTALQTDVTNSFDTATPPADAKTRVSQFMKDLQDEICQTLEK